MLRAAFDPRRLTDEVRAAFGDGFDGNRATNTSADAEISFRYLPMMSARRLLDTDVLPVRAKAVEYHGSSSWHRDSESDVASIGFACYLEPLTATTGALRVVPGSHRHDGADRGAMAVETTPGDGVGRRLRRRPLPDLRRALASFEFAGRR